MTDQNDKPGPAPEDEGDAPPQDELWKKITSETEMLRSRTTPAYLKQQIMDSLPEEAPRPWYDKLFRKDK